MPIRKLPSNEEICKSLLADAIFYRGKSEKAVNKDIARVTQNLIDNQQSTPLSLSEAARIYIARWTAWHETKKYSENS